MKIGNPTIVGVVNLTADSFSDGGLYLDAQSAIAHSRKLLSDGADIIELGAAASSGAVPVAPAEEIGRLRPVLDRLLESGAVLSVDAFQAETQRYCLGRGVDYLNDVSGFADREIYGELAGATCRLVLMHSTPGGGRITRAAADAEAVYSSICGFFERRLRELETAGIARARLILDPGMGWFLAGNPEPSLLALSRIDRLKQSFGLPVLVSVSRKSFLGTLTGRAIARRGAATLAAEIFAAGQGADYVRTHDPGALADALKVIGALKGEQR